MAEREKPANAAKSRPKKSKYIDTLSGEALARYNKKLELIDGVNPYQLHKSSPFLSENFINKNIKLIRILR